MLRTHPAVKHLPALRDASFSVLFDDMAAHGQRLPIVLYKGMVWDGRARHEACLRLGFKPWLVPLRGEDPAAFYIRSNYCRAGEPNSPARKSIVSALMQADNDESRAAARLRRGEWLKAARAEFEDFVRDRREACAVCGKHIEFVHAHHSFPLSLQFECGVEDAIQDYQWLCPVHHKDVHVLLNGYLLGSRDLSFLGRIPNASTQEWLGIERCAQRGIDLCCEALGRVPGENKLRRYDPPYALFLIRNSIAVFATKQRKQASKFD